MQKLLLDSAATVDEKVMSLALQTLTSAHQHKAACSLYRTHARSLDMMNNAAHDADILFRTTQMVLVATLPIHRYFGLTLTLYIGYAISRLRTDAGSFT